MGIHVQRLTPVDMFAVPTGISKEQALWVQVIARAIQDAVWYWGETEEYQRKLQRQAERWLWHPLHEPAFFEVCELAGVDPQWIRTLARKCLDRRINDGLGLEGTTSHKPIFLIGRNDNET